MLELVHIEPCVGNLEAISFPPEALPWYKIGRQIVERRTANCRAMTLQHPALTASTYFFAALGIPGLFRNELERGVEMLTHHRQP